MKKLIFLTLLLSVALLFVSCQDDTDTQMEETTGNKETVTTVEVTSDEKTVAETYTTAESTNGETLIETTETTQIGEETSTEVVTTNKEDTDISFADRGDRCDFYFDSYDEFICALNDIENSSLKDGLDKYGEYFKKVLNAFENKSIYPIIPYYEDSQIELLFNNITSSITFFSHEDYDIPWIWYKYKFGEKYWRVQVCYLDALEIPEINSEHTFLDIRYILKPTYPTPDNYTEKPNSKNVYEKEITVCGRTVTALINEKIDDNAEIGFRMDGMLVIIYGPIDMLTDEFLSSFDLKAV